MLKDIFREPLAVEALFAVLLLVTLYLFFRMLRGVADRISRRRALKEFVSGVDLFFKGEHHAARQALEKVLERDPENSEARILLGDACRELGDLAEAHKHHYQVAQVFGQDLPRNRLSLGRDLLAMGKVGEAVPHLERAVQADPEDRATAELLLDASLESGRLGEAVALARKLADGAVGEEAERARRRHAGVCAVAGRELLRRDELKEGGQLLRTALRLNPSLVGPRLELVRSAYLNSSARAAEKELLAHLREMSRLAEEGPVVFEPPLPAPHADGGDGGARSRGAVGALPQAGQDSSDPKALPGAAPALPAPVGDSGASPAVGVPAPRGTRAVAATEIPDAPLPVDASSLVRTLLPREAVYLCAACGRGEVAFSECCQGCGSFGTLVATDDSALLPVAEMSRVFDEILENRSFIRSLVRRAAAGDVQAATRLLEAGPAAVPGIFREVMRVADSSALVQVLSRMGTHAVRAILDGYRRARAFSTKRLVREGMRAFRSPDGLVVKALAGMGDSVVSELDSLLESGEKELRIIALDVLIRLGRADVVEEIRFSVPTKEILERLNACPREEVGPFLDACPAGGFLADQVLSDRTFDADEALVQALGRGESSQKLRRILMERGFSSRAYEELELLWGEPGMDRVVSDVIRSYGKSAVDHLLKTYTTMSLPEEVREGALRLFLDLGGEELERLVERITEGDTDTERAVLRIIRAFGSRAVPTLVRVYGKSGIREKIGLNRRRLLFRKMTLIRALGQIGTYDAVQGLKQIHDKEGDADLKRRIRGVLERLSGRSER